MNIARGQALQLPAGIEVRDLEGEPIRASKAPVPGDVVSDPSTGDGLLAVRVRSQDRPKGWPPIVMIEARDLECVPTPMPAPAEGSMPSYKARAPRGPRAPRPAYDRRGGQSRPIARWGYRLALYALAALLVRACVG